MPKIEYIKALLRRILVRKILYPNCEIKISDVLLNTMKNFNTKEIDLLFYNLNIEDFSLSGYSSDAAIKVDMLAPKNC